MYSCFPQDAAAVHELEQADAASRRNESAGVRRRLERQKVRCASAPCCRKFVCAATTALLASRRAVVSATPFGKDPRY